MSKEFEIARLLMIDLARNGHIERSRGFGWSSRTYPLYADQLEEMFADDFEMSVDDVNAVMRAIDEPDLRDEPISFYRLEDVFAGTYDRIQLINVCRMAFLSQRFTERTWDALLKNGECPVEAFSIRDGEEGFDLMV